MAIVVNPENVATAASADSHASQAHKNIPSRQSSIFQQQGCLLTSQRQSNIFQHVICQFTHAKTLQKV